MNPLLSPSPLKHAAVPFDQIKPEHFAPALTRALAHGRERLGHVRTESASFDHTFRGLEACGEEMEFVYILFSNLVSAHGGPELQALAAELGPQVADFANDILLDAAVFERVRDVYERRQTLNLSPTQLRLVEKTYRDFALSGATLPDDKKARLREIDARWSQLSPLFRQNVLGSTNQFELWIEDEADLDGLSPSIRDAARAAAVEKKQPTRWLFGLNLPSYGPFMTFSKRRPLREKMYRAYVTRAVAGEFDNQPVITEIVALAREKATLLGQPSYAHFALLERMAETPEKVLDFLGQMHRVVKPAAERDVAEVQKFAVAHGGPAELQPWDFSFYAERLKEKTYAFDEEELRPYFQLENVLEGVFEHARRLFDLEFKPTTGYPIYHDEVRVFEVRKKSGDFIGLFYADFFPRATKSPGAWMTGFYQQGHFRGQPTRPHVAIVCNFTKPTADRPSLLTFGEVRTLFHEFGHALHGLLSQVEFRSLSGTNVYLDFVELPSQLMENWAKEEESLKLFARHYRTGEVIPMSLIEQLKKSQRYLAGYNALRQLQFAYLDIAWFLNPPAKGESIAAFEARVNAPTQVLPRAEGALISPAFAHIFGGGYASGYYSYKWAEALEADAFEMFRERGIFDRDSAIRLEEFILSKGGSEHPMRLFEGFRGRAPDPEALLRRDGLVG